MINMRYVGAIFLIALIIIMGWVVYQKKDSIFKYEVKIGYPDGCVETYVNNKIMTDVCVNGRLLIENGSTLWNINPHALNLNQTINLTNLTI